MNQHTDIQIFEEFFEDGTIKSICQKNQHGLTGEYKIFYKNGKLKQQSNYLNGKLHGKSTTWDTNANKLYEMDFLLNKLNGLFIVYEQGTKKMSMLYINGTLNGKYEIYANNGNLIQVSNYFNNLLNGESCHYNELTNDIIKQEFYKDGKLNGSAITYYPNKIKMLEQQYLNGTLNGLTNQYYPNGNLKDSKAFANGKLIYQKSFDLNGNEHSETVADKGFAKKLLFFFTPKKATHKT